MNQCFCTYKRSLVIWSFGALFSASLCAWAGDQRAFVANPLLDIQHNQDAVKSLRWLYENEEEFHSLIDNMFANIHPLPDGRPNPWQGKDIDDLYQFVENWSSFLPTTDNGLTKIREFQALIDTNIYGEQFVTEEPGRSWTKHMSNVRRVTMTSPASLKRIENWVSDPRIHIDDYVIPDGGFKSFNEFFVRTLKEPRPVNRPADDSVVSSPADCFIEMLSATITDSTLIQTKVGQRLKVTEMLANSSYAEKFIGGTGLRCILTPTDYHHYHAPVNGRVVESREQVNGVLYGGVPGPAM